MRAGVLALLAELEARLDFDEDLPAMDEQRLRDAVTGLQVALEEALRTARQGALLRTGLQASSAFGLLFTDDSSVCNCCSLLFSFK